MEMGVNGLACLGTMTPDPLILFGRSGPRPTAGRGGQPRSGGSGVRPIAFTAPPNISAIPYINGVRLREELEQARELRHKIVHEGERIAYPFTGRMQRVMETMSWFFNWLAENGLQRKRGLEGNPLTNSMRGRLTLDFTYTPSGVVVRQHDLAGPVVFAEEELRKQLVAAIDKETADIEKFALMALKQVGFEGSHSPAPEPDSSFVFERLSSKMATASSRYSSTTLMRW
jgi:hypothetical protein